MYNMRYECYTSPKIYTHETDGYMMRLCMAPQIADMNCDYDSAGPSRQRAAQNDVLCNNNINNAIRFFS